MKQLLPAPRGYWPTHPKRVECVVLASERTKPSVANLERFSSHTELSYLVLSEKDGRCHLVTTTYLCMHHHHLCMHTRLITCRNVNFCKSCRSWCFSEEADERESRVNQRCRSPLVYIYCVDQTLHKKIQTAQNRGRTLHPRKNNIFVPIITNH